MLILASKSPRRSMLLREINVDFEVIESNYEEKHDISSDPARLATLHAQSKAEEVFGRVKGGADDVILGVDTLVTLNGEIFGKPKNASDAFEMIKKLSGHTHQVLSAMCLIRTRDEKKITHIEITEVTFHKLSDEQIEEYIQTNEWEDKAGAYAIQGQASGFVSAIEGSFSNVVGLPKEVFLDLYDKLI
ncbi:MAG: Maf family protein [Candidatus Peregrinibacteria bacterium]|nr:Maf family protein [Candidatus Peregrinibacteria bacterium]